MGEVVMLLDLLDGVDWESPKWHYLIAIGHVSDVIRRRLGAVDRLPKDRLHTNDEALLEEAFEKTGLNALLRGSAVNRR